MNEYALQTLIEVLREIRNELRELNKHLANKE